MSRPDSVVVILSSSAFGVVTVEDVREALKIEDNFFIGFLRGRLRNTAMGWIQALRAAKRGTVLDLREDSKPRIQKWLAEYVDNTRTPLTTENVLAWATAATEDKITDEDLRNEAIDEKLIELLLSHAFFCCVEDKANDLQNDKLDLLRKGCKGYYNMTRTELLAEIQNNIIEQFNEDLEDVFEMLNFYQDAD